MSGTIRCVVADDHGAVVKGISDVLTAGGITVVGTARRGDHALRLIEQAKPDVALLDARMPGMSGVEVIRGTRTVAPRTRTLLYTGYPDVSLLDDAVDAGASGIVLKEAPVSDVVRAVETCARQGTYFDPVLAGAVMKARLDDEARLTKRERETLGLLSDGLSNEEIGKRLFISPETVRTHVRKAMRKLGASTRTQAVAAALRRSLID